MVGGYWLRRESLLELHENKELQLKRRAWMCERLRFGKTVACCS